MHARLDRDTVHRPRVNEFGNLLGRVERLEAVLERLDLLALGLLGGGLSIVHVSVTVARRGGGNSGWLVRRRHWLVRRRNNGIGTSF